MNESDTEDSGSDSGSEIIMMPHDLNPRMPSREVYVRKSECQICYEVRVCDECAFGHSVCHLCSKSLRQGRSCDVCPFCQPLAYAAFPISDDEGEHAPLTTSENPASEDPSVEHDEDDEHCSSAVGLSTLSVLAVIVAALLAGVVVSKTLLGLVLVPPRPQWATYSDPVIWHWFALSLVGLHIMTGMECLRQHCCTRRVERA